MNEAAIPDLPTSRSDDTEFLDTNDDGIFKYIEETISSVEQGIAEGNDALKETRADDNDTVMRDEHQQKKRTLEASHEPSAVAGLLQFAGNLNIDGVVHHRDLQPDATDIVVEGQN